VSSVRNNVASPLGRAALAVLLLLLFGVVAAPRLLDRAFGRSSCYGPAPITLPSGQLLLTDDRGARRYDPPTNRWADAGRMVRPRCGHTATALPDGRVLVAGGIAGSAGRYTYYDAAELYDPATDRWRAAARMPTPRAGHQAIILPDGRVLLTGGLWDRRSAFDTGMLYDPATDRWSSTAPMAQPRVAATTTLLPGGQVLMAGGLAAGDGTGCCRSGGGALSSAERYDPATDRWRRVGDMPTPRQGHRATPLADGRVLVTGGRDGYEANPSRLYDTGEVYDPASDRWQSTGPLGRPLAGHTLTSLPDGQVLLIREAYSGYTEEQRDDSPAERYDPVANRWLPAGALLAARSGFTATPLGDGRVLVAGGVSGPFYPTQEGAAGERQRRGLRPGDEPLGGGRGHAPRPR